MTGGRTQLEARLAGAGLDISEAATILAAAGGDEAKAEELVASRVAGAPLAYLLGRQHFMGIELLAGPGALVPREETELLGETARKILVELSADAPDLRVIDMCCGSGNLACAMAMFLPKARVWASDLTDGCVALAQKNVSHLGIEGRVTVVQGDLFAPLEGGELIGNVDAVICNPPYISTGRLAKDRATLLEHEPREAFDGGPYGLSIHQRVIKDAVRFLKPGGYLLFEMGLGQERQLQILFERSRTYVEVQFVCDAAGAPRVAYAKKKQE